MYHFSEQLLDRLIRARHVAVLTGSGISAESGVATFRGEGGIWQKFKAEELANMDAFMRNPQLVWEWYEYRRKIISEVQPNSAHFALVEMEKFYPHFAISTQNVDGLHSRAGSQSVYELHGNILRNRCNRCGKKMTDIQYEQERPLPTCECGGMIRPDVVWFGEMLPEEALEASFKEASNAEVYFSIGTSAVVYPAAMLPVEAKRHGAYVIEINLEKTPLTHQVDESYQAKAGELLPELWATVRQKKTM